MRRRGRLLQIWPCGTDVLFEAGVAARGVYLQSAFSFHLLS